MRTDTFAGIDHHAPRCEHALYMDGQVGGGVSGLRRLLGTIGYEGACASLVSTAMQGQELKALLKETIRELLHEEPGLLGAAVQSSASEKPNTGAEHSHGEFCTFANRGVDGRSDGRSGVLWVQHGGRLGATWMATWRGRGH